MDELVAVVSVIAAIVSVHCGALSWLALRDIEKRDRRRDGEIEKREPYYSDPW